MVCYNARAKENSVKILNTINSLLALIRSCSPSSDEQAVRVNSPFACVKRSRGVIFRSGAACRNEFIADCCHKSHGDDGY